MKQDRGRSPILPWPGLVGESDGVLGGYILEQPALTVWPGRERAWGYALFVAGPIGQVEADPGSFSSARLDGVLPLDLSQPASVESQTGAATPFPKPTPVRLRPLRPIGRLVRATALRLVRPTQPPMAAIAPALEATTPRGLRPIRSGQAYRIASPPARGLVRPELAEALETVFEHFAHERGFSADKPLEIQLSRGFKAGSHGHGEGRAADIVAVGSQGLLAWKQAWDQAMAAAAELSDLQQRAAAIAAEQKRNLGYGLYKALQAQGGWRVNPGGWRPYRGVIQLFGPWTATEGPWKAMRIEKPTPEQRQRLRDQRWAFRAHQDHIHVAR